MTKTMKVFEFWMEPDPERAIYDVKPTKEFEKFLGDPKWVEEFNERICWAFLDTMVRFEGGSELYGKKRIPAVYIDAAKGDGTAHVYIGNRTYIKGISDDFKGQKKKKFVAAQNKLLRKATAAIKEYIETVEEI